MRKFFTALRKVLSRKKEPIEKIQVVPKLVKEELVKEKFEKRMPDKKWLHKRKLEKIARKSRDERR